MYIFEFASCLLIRSQSLFSSQKNSRRFRGCFRKYYCLSNLIYYAELPKGKCLAGAGTRTGMPGIELIEKNVAGRQGR